MNRFDDQLKWKAARLFAPALISAFMVYVAFRVQLENRLTVVEVKTTTVDARLDRIENKIDMILERHDRVR